MNTISKSLGILALALMMPFTASAAMAAKAPQATPATNAVVATSQTTLKSGLVAKTAQPETIKVAGRRGRGRGLALGIIAGAAAAAIITSNSRSRHYYRERPRYSHRRRYNRCERWAYNCDCGIRRACRKYYRYCD